MGATGRNVTKGMAVVVMDVLETAARVDLAMSVMCLTQA